MRQEPEWSDAAEIYQLYRAGITTRDLAVKFNRSQSMIMAMKRSAQCEAKRRLGGESEPDILAEKDGKKYVIACKVYEDSKATMTMPIAEIKPEPYYAKAQNAELLVYFYNMAWGWN